MPKRSDLRITKRFVDSLPVRDRDFVVWDRDLPGFGVRVQTSGRKAYVVQSRGPAGSKRVTIGRHGDVTTAEARKQAAAIIRRIKRGAPPVPGPAPEEPTVAELAARYMRVHASVNCKPASVELYRCVIDNHILPALGAKRIGAVQRADVAALHYSLHERPGIANSTLQVLSQLFFKAEQWGWLPGGKSPCRSHRKYKLRTRRRYLTSEEYRRLGDVLRQGEEDGSLNEVAVAAIRLLILTGCRRDEVLTLRWDDVDFRARELRLRDAKTGTHLVAMTSAVASVLHGIPRVPGNPWVIVGEKPGRRLMTLKSVWRRVRVLAGLRNMRLHDLRHSYASRALAIGENLTMIGELLNHVQVETTARYAHLMQDAELAAAARVGNSIGLQLRGRPEAGSRHSNRRYHAEASPTEHQQSNGGGAEGAQGNNRLGPASRRFRRTGVPLRGSRVRRTGAGS